MLGSDVLASIDPALQNAAAGGNSTNCPARGHRPERTPHLW